MSIGLSTIESIQLNLHQHHQQGVLESASISIEDICGNLNKLKKDHEATSKACIKAKKDKASLHKLTGQHQEEIEKLKPYIHQQIQSNLKLEQKVFDLQWCKQFKEQELSRVKTEITDDSSINETLIDSYEETLRSIQLDLLNFKSKMEECRMAKSHLSDDIVKEGNNFSALCEAHKKKEVEVKEKMEETNQLHEILDSLEDKYSSILKENGNRLKVSNNNQCMIGGGVTANNNDVEKALIIEQQKCSDQLKNVNNELRELRQKKQALTQQIDSKRKLKEAMNEELKNLAKELKSKGSADLSSTSLRKAIIDQSSASDLMTSPFSSHFSKPPSSNSSAAQKFSFKKPLVNNADNHQKISPVTPDVRLLKRKTSPNDSSTNGEVNTSSTAARVDISSFAYKKNDYKKATPNNNPTTTYTFKKLRKD